jgi:hypothetical protein
VHTSSTIAAAEEIFETTGLLLFKRLQYKNGFVSDLIAHITTVEMLYLHFVYCRLSHQLLSIDLCVYSAWIGR